MFARSVSSGAPSAGEEPSAVEASGVVEVTEIEGVLVARLGGEADADARGRIEEQLVAAAEGRADPLVVDLSALRYLDSAGVRSLFVVADHLAAQGRQLHVAVPSGSRLVRVLRIIQLDALVQVHATVAEACTAVRASAG